MKKITLALACLLIAGTAIADKSIRVANASRSFNMTVTIEKCRLDSHRVPVCTAEGSKEITGKSNISISIPDEQDSFLHVESVSAINPETGEKMLYTFTGSADDKLRRCSSFDASGIILLKAEKSLSAVTCTKATGSE